MYYCHFPPSGPAPRAAQLQRHPYACSNWSGPGYGSISERESPISISYFLALFTLWGQAGGLQHDQGLGPILEDALPQLGQTLRGGLGAELLTDLSPLTRVHRPVGHPVAQVNPHTDDPRDTLIP